MIRFSSILLFLAGMMSLLTFQSCSDSKEYVYGEFVPSKTVKDGVMKTLGVGNFQYNRYAPLRKKPVNVYYYLPTKGGIADMPILFAFHGADRVAMNQIIAWQNIAEYYGIVVIAPEFTKENGYAENDYQFGGVYTSATFKDLRNEEEWTYQLVEQLFDYVCNEIDSNAKTYNMFGHSAGGQFVHRFVMAMPEARVNRAVAANPGSWTFPYVNGLVGVDMATYGWPYSVKGVPFGREEGLKHFFSKNLFVQIGTNDLANNKIDDPHFPTDNASMAEGGTRYERAHNFYTACQEVAGQMQVPLNIRLADVQDAGHSSQQMVYGLRVPTLADPTKRGENSAYDLLFD